MCNLNLFRPFLAVFGNAYRDPEAKPFKLHPWEALESLTVLSDFKVK